jgi:ParB/RepB/Spo0J family partition protein
MSKKKLNTERLDDLMHKTSVEDNFDMSIINPSIAPIPASTKRALRKTTDPRNLIPNPKNRFTMRRDSEYEALKESIRQSGIHNDIIVKPVPDDPDKFIILSGERRNTIALELELPKVPIKIEEFESDLEEITFLIQENIGTRQKYPLDIARSIQEMEALLNDEEITGRRRDYIGEKLGISSRSVHNYALLIDLPEKIQEWLNNGLLTVTQAQTIASLSKSFQLELMKAVEDVMKDGMDEGQMKAVIKDALTKIVKDAKRAEKGQTKQSEDKKSPNANKALKKAVGCLVPLQEQFTVPKTKKKKEEALQHINAALQLLESMKAKMVEAIDGK